jgi:hypothetical protein
MQHANDVNPYQSPLADSKPPMLDATSPPRRRLRWRVIPVTLLYLYGGCAILVGVLYLGPIPKLN